ncbi:MAG: hypothetical protein ACRDSZ_03000 [Pseudonocardiaceae bacterium]
MPKVTEPSRAASQRPQRAEVEGMDGDRAALADQQGIVCNLRRRPARGE